MKRSCKSSRHRMTAGLLCLVLLFSSFYVVSFSAETDLPQAFLVYDQENGALLTYDASAGKYVANENYTAAFVGEGMQFEDAGYLSEKALGFSDQTTHLEIAAAEGYSLAPGGNGITVSFWMKEVFTTGNSTAGSNRGDVRDKFETVIAGTDAGGESALLCVDGLYYLIDSDNSNRHYVQGSDNRVGSGTTFFYSYYDWVQYTATITADEVLIYQNGEVHYGYNSATGKLTAGGTATGTYTAVDFAKTLFDGLTAEGGKLEFRSDLYSARNTRSLRLDGLKIYDGALTADQAKAVYQNEQPLLTVTLDYSDRMTTETLSVSYGEVPTLPTPTREGYVFTGWYSDAAATEKFETTGLKESVFLYAGWTPLEYSINYVLNGGVLTDAPEVYTPAQTVMLPVPTREGYTFTGWYRTPELEGSLTQTYLEQFGDLTVYAGWSINAYNVTYDLAGGINHTDNPTVITAEDGTVILKDPLKIGYIFNGWYSGDEAVSEITANGADIALTAVWTVIPGDVNLNGKINIFDAVCLLQVLNDTSELAEDVDCDYDGDGALTVGDALLLMRYIDGSVDTLK